MLHLASSTGWTELSCGEAQAFSGGGELGVVGGVLSFLIHSVSAGCWGAGEADGPPPWSWGLSSSCLALSRGCVGSCTLCWFFLGEEAFKELWHLDSELAESWEPAVCFVWPPWTSSAENRTFFSDPRGDEASGVVSESGLGDTLIFESWSFWFPTSASVRASSSSKNSSNVVSGVWKKRWEQIKSFFNNVHQAFHIDTYKGLISHLWVLSFFICLPSKNKKNFYQKLFCYIVNMVGCKSAIFSQFPTLQYATGNYRKVTGIEILI